MGQLTSAIKQFRKVARGASFVLVLYWLLIFTGTHLPASFVSQVSLSDKLTHTLAFAGLSFLLAWAIPSRGVNLAHVRWAAVIALVYCLIDEWTQNFIPGRVCDIWDMAADVVGIVLGIGGYLIMRHLLLRWAWGRRLILGMARL